VRYGGINRRDSPRLNQRCALVLTHGQLVVWAETSRLLGGEVTLKHLVGARHDPTILDSLHRGGDPEAIEPSSEANAYPRLIAAMSTETSMRVLHLTTEYPPLITGGLGTVLGGLARASVQIGLEVAVLVGTKERPTGPQPFYLQPWCADRNQAEVPVFMTIRDDAPEFALRLTRWWRPNIVHLHVVSMWHTARRLRKQLGVPIVYSVHSLDILEYQFEPEAPEFLDKWELQQSAIEEANIVVAPSRSERDRIVGFCPEAEGHVVVAGHGIEDVPQIGPLRRAAASTTVLYSGRFVRRKGLNDLLAAIPRVLERTTRLRFVLVGGWPGATVEETASRTMPALRRNTGRVRFTGWLSPEGVRRQYRRAHVLVVPSRYEPFGMVVLEGMLHGLAVVSTRGGGPAEILEDGRTGILVPPGDASALADEILRLHHDPEKWARLVEEAGREVRGKWLWSQRVQRVIDLYREVASAAPERKPSF
jgi:glycogen(starch) synthase